MRKSFIAYIEKKDLDKIGWRSFSDTISPEQAAMHIGPTWKIRDNVYASKTSVRVRVLIEVLQGQE